MAANANVDYSVLVSFQMMELHGVVSTADIEMQDNRISFEHSDFNDRTVDNLDSIDKSCVGVHHIAIEVTHIGASKGVDNFDCLSV